MYDIYKKIKPKEEFYSEWEDEKLAQLTNDLKEHIYNKYVTKCKVFQRDGFKCQNVNCITPESELTMHHIKFQKNGGTNKSNNCITLCRTCHKAFHRGKSVITFPDVEYLPSKISGHTFRLSESDKIDWKKVCAKMRDFRKSIKQECGINVSKYKLALMMRWLFVPYHDLEDYDDDEMGV